MIRVAEEMYEVMRRVWASVQCAKDLVRCDQSSDLDALLAKLA